MIIKFNNIHITVTGFKLIQKEKINYYLTVGNPVMVLLNLVLRNFFLGLFPWQKRLSKVRLLMKVTTLRFLVLVTMIITG